MKVLVGGFDTESNTYIPVMNNITDFRLTFGEKLAEDFKGGAILRAEGIELIPAVAASSGPSVLFASICDPKVCRILGDFQIGSRLRITLGVGYDAMSEPVVLDVVIKAKGTTLRPVGISVITGNCVTVTVEGKPVDIIITDDRAGYYHKEQYEAAGVNWLDYDITVVKLGYIFPELKEKAAFYVMSLTGGATQQKIWEIPYKRIPRPIFPIDDI